METDIEKIRENAQVLRKELRKLIDTFNNENVMKIKRATIHVDTFESDGYKSYYSANAVELDLDMKSI